MRNDKAMNNQECSRMQEKLRRYDLLSQEASYVRDKDRFLIRDIFEKDLHMGMEVGIGFQRSYGSVLSGDYFSFFKLPDGNSMLIFSDISGHGLPAYTTLIRFRSAVILTLKEFERRYVDNPWISYSDIIRGIAEKFTDIMDFSGSNDFASVNFVFFREHDDHIRMEFYNRSMLFPIVFRRDGTEVVVADLNSRNPELNWEVDKGYLLGSDIRSLIGDEEYFYTPGCTFDIREGDLILFYSDGLTEAFDSDTQKEQFGEKRLVESIIEMIGLPPQLIINNIYDRVYNFIGSHEDQKDDMTALLLDLTKGRKMK